jgi:hypothetical protein
MVAMRWTDPEHDIAVLPYEGARSLLDPLSNTPVLRYGHLADGAAGFTTGVLPLSSALTFLHEFTHHWCFDSVVGEAAYLSTMKAGRIARSSFFQDSKPSRRERCIHSGRTIRSHCALRLLQPVTEGLALFAEFDSFPRTGYPSPPLEWVTRCFVRQELEPHELLPECLRLLDTARRNRGTVERKCGILVSPLFTDARGYLAGYLMVKKLWSTAASEIEVFRWGDVFLEFCKRYFYEDWELVDLLLGSAYSAPEDDARLVSAHIQDRISRFALWKVDADLQRFFYPQPETETVFGDDGSVQYRLDRVPALSPKAERGRLRLLQECADLATEKEGMLGLRQLRARSVAPVARLDCSFRMKDGIVDVLVDGRVIMRFGVKPSVLSDLEKMTLNDLLRAVPEALDLAVYDFNTGEAEPLFKSTPSMPRWRDEKGEWSGVGWIDLCVDSRDGCSFLSPVSAFPFQPIVLRGTLPDVLADDYPTLLLRQDEQSARSVDISGRKMAQDLFGESSILTPMQHEMEESLNRYVVPLAVSSFSVNPVTVKDEASDFGLMAWVDDPDRLEALSLLSLYGSMGSNREDADRAAKEMLGKSLEDVEAYATNLNPEGAKLNAFPPRHVENFLAPYVF